MKPSSQGKNEDVVPGIWWLYLYNESRGIDLRNNAYYKKTDKIKVNTLAIS